MGAPAKASNDSVSVVVPTCNSEQLLEACLVSIRGQTYEALELIVVDNFSDDATPEIAKRYAHVFAQAGPERSAQRNRGSELASGAFLLMIDSDMVLDPRVVEDCVDTARMEEAAAIVVPERSIGRGFWAACKALERSCYIGDDTIEAPRFFASDVFREHGGFDEALVAGEDWDLAERLRPTVRFARVQSEIRHLEGDLRLRDTMRKKFFYGRRLSGYLTRHPQAARRQLVLIRPAFVRHRHRLARQPILTTGMIVMKAAELAAGALGVALSRFRKP